MSGSQGVRPEVERIRLLKRVHELENIVRKLLPHARRVARTFPDPEGALAQADVNAAVELVGE